MVLYRACAAAEFETAWGDGVWVLSSNLVKARDMVRSIIDGYMRDLESKDPPAIVLSGNGNFRKDLTDSYKSHRKGTRKPLGYVDLKEWLYDAYGSDFVVSKDGLEADDYMGILATKPGSGVERIIVSDDKDMKTIPGTLYRLGELTYIDDAEADRFWLQQTLTGDPADGYKGCPGIGEVRAKAILDRPGDPWENVRQAFLKAGLTEDDAILQARLARILRWSDWDTEKQAVRLWSPHDTK